MSYPEKFIKWFASFLCGLTLANAVLAYSPETNFWKERAKYTSAEKEPVQLASLLNLSGRHPGMSQSGIQNNLFKPWIPTFVGMTTTLEFQKILQSLPASLGSIRKISLLRPSGYGGQALLRLPQATFGGRTIIHIQDVHLNQEAQSNIGKTI